MKLNGHNTKPGGSLSVGIRSLQLLIEITQSVCVRGSMFVRVSEGLFYCPVRGTRNMATLHEYFTLIIQPSYSLQPHRHRLCPKWHPILYVVHYF